MRNPGLLIVLIVLAFLTASLGWSQAVNATLVGTVTDVTGAVESSAKVTITETRGQCCRPAVPRAAEFPS